MACLASLLCPLRRSGDYTDIESIISDHSAPSSGRASSSSSRSPRSRIASIVSSITSFGSRRRKSQSDIPVFPEDDSDKRAVQIPDLFSSIMSVPCDVCPHYMSARKKSENYVNRAYKFDDKARLKNHLINFAYMAAAWAPQSDEEALVTMIDWLHWTFYFDDQFDEGHLSTDLEGALKEINKTLALFESDAPLVSMKEDGIAHMFQDTWRRFKLRSSKGLQARYIKSIKDYCDGVINQVKVNRDGTIITLEQYMAFRRASIGSYPSFALIEYCHGIELPQSVISHNSIATCEEVATDITILHNDILSYKKDLEQNVPHNIIILLQGQGMGEQDAIDHVNGMLQDCFRRWYGALAELPAWGERIDRDVLRYIDACRNVALGNLYWSFESGRYFGKDGPRVRETRVMLLPGDGWLSR